MSSYLNMIQQFVLIEHMALQLLIKAVVEVILLDDLSHVKVLVTTTFWKQYLFSFPIN